MVELYRRAQGEGRLLMSRPDADSKLTACHDCDLLMRVRLEGEGRACCPRCGALVRRYGAQRQDAELALLLTGVIAFLLANVYPVVTLEAAGARSAATLWQTVVALERQGMLSVAMLVMFTGIVMPSLELGSMLYVRLPLAFGHVPRGFPWLMRLKILTRPWCMVEVFLLGILVSLVKLVSLATVHVGVGLLALFALIMLMAATASRFNPEDLWERYQQCRATA